MRVEEAKYLAKKIMMAGEIPLLVGHFGVGKTDIARDIAEETGRELIILVLSQMEPGDLIGLPARTEEKTVFLKPDWWPESGDTILFLDEINRAHRSVRNAIMQLLVDRRIHNHILPEGTWIMAAMNPPEEEYDQADLITDPAFISRFFILEVNPDVSEWLEWAEKNNVSKEVRDFIRDYPEFYVIAAGIVGPEAAKAFYDSFFQRVKIPSVESVLFDGKIENLEDIHAANTLVLRIVDFLSKVDVRTLERHLDDVSKNLVRLSEIMPRESFYGVLRFLVDEAQKEGEKSWIFDKILEKMLEREDMRKMVNEL
ncbi:MAG: putative ATPase 5 [Thermotoga sp.]|nr:putative ATPase 5 [Thermotoga sp.]